MSKPLRVLYLEDEPLDGELAARALADDGLVCEMVNARTKDEFEGALKRETFDAILSDFSVPSYGGLTALSVARSLQPGVPFLFLSGTLGEERVVESLRSGANDFVLKDRMERLAPALRRALHEAQLLRAKKQAEENLRRSQEELAEAQRLVQSGQETESELRESEERFRSVWENSIDGMRLTDRMGRIVDVNEAFCRLVKIPRAHLLGQVFSVMYKGHGPQDGIEVYQDRFVTGQIPARITAPVQLWNSEELDLEISSSFIESGQRGKLLLSIFRNVTERKRAQARLAAFSHLGQKLGMAGTAREAADILMEVADQLLGWDACTFALYSAVENKLHHALNMDTIEGRRVECSAVLADGSLSPMARRVINEGAQLILKERPSDRLAGASAFGDKARPSASLMFVPIRNGARVTGLLSIQSYKPKAYDERSLETLQALADHCAGALERIQAQDERKQLEEQLRQAQKMEAIGQLAGGIAHDFNNLLLVMRGNAELLLMNEDAQSPETSDGLKQIIAAAERAANLTRQLLAFSRKQVMQSQPLVLNDVVANLTKMLKRIIGEDIQLQCQYAARLPAIQADAGMLEQVLVNLVVNARDAMPQGGQLLVATEHLSLQETDARANPEARPGEVVCLQVRDTGQGIAPENLARIFEPFFTTKEPGRGTGLGLATVYGIIKQHQGWIQVSSQVGVGTTFKIFLPALATAANLPPPETTAAELPGGHEKILLVEDDYSVRLITRRVLESVGYEVWEATSGPEAQRVWEQQAGEFDLLLSDIVMPQGVNGRDLAVQFRIKKPALKIILMSGYSGSVAGKDTEFFRRTQSQFLQKPVSSRTLLETVRRCLDT
ncbi:putative Response receiver sensor histidine kinase response regulator, PAS and GAF domain-containing [Verrucomicrobia bacterium]|nr:putative Response receiver sensor histidine kinase response regulator, PAS and GAF domain-containing [Verrucomicrobiota bacterium]